MPKKKEVLTEEEKLEQALVKEEDWPYDVPNNWIWTRLGFLVHEIKNGTTSKQNKEDLGVKVTRIESIQNYKIDLNRLGYIEDKNCIKENDWYIENDIALSHINSAEHVGKTALIYSNLLPLVHGMNLLRIRFNVICFPSYFYFYSQSYEYKSKILERINMAVNQVSINQKQLNSLEIPLPPINEQQRIVQKIENLFKKLDKAKEIVQNALDSFENRKSAILHKAFTGELTKKWREEHGIGMDSWEFYKLKDICNINPKKVDVKSLPDDLKVTFVPMACVSDILGVIQTTQNKSLKEVKKGYTNFCVNDIIFAKITPCMENGKIAIVENLENNIGYGSTEFHVLRCTDKLLNKYLYNLIRGRNFRDEAKSVMTGAVGQQRVPKEFLEEFEINLPIYQEQKEIVRILDSLLEKEQKSKELLEVLDKIDLMKKSILGKAFRGKLGTNDPSEESAIELLKECLKNS